MALDWITTPVSEELPCGPDLEAADDAEFVDYYYDALGRLPERYLTPGVDRGDDGRSPDVIFDPKSVSLDAELRQIDPMLKRSRDVRLMVLRAQWQVLAHRLGPMAETVGALADMVEAFGAEAHPAIAGGISDRREALSELAGLHTVRLPLMYLAIDGPGAATLRRLKVARGEFSAGDGEEGVDASAITRALADPGERGRVDAAHAALLSIKAACDRIAAACRANESGPFSPGLDPLVETVTEMLGMIGEARTDLRDAAADALADAPAPEAEADAPGAEGDTLPGGDGGGGGGGTQTVTTTIHVGPVANHAAARQALLAVEGYLVRREPSSAALLLVTQARQLIGKSLMEALDILIPEHAGRAVVSFGPTDGFRLTTDRLRALSGEARAGEGDDDGEVPDPPEVSDTNGAAAVLRSVEDFFRARERSSPIPVLLQRARAYMAKDFQALIDELIPAPPAAEE